MSATVPATAIATATERPTGGVSATKPRLYDFAEGWGSVYGRFVRNRLCRRLAGRYGLQNILEAPCNAESYFSSPGTQSVVFAEEGCAVSLVHHDEVVVEKTRDFWSALGRDDVLVLNCPDMYHLPFDDDAFDLVWNFDSIPLFDDPQAFIAEMGRVSRFLVMIILPNPRNIGYPVHSLMTRLKGSESVWGERAWMDAGRVKRALERQGFNLLECGLVDMPPWPGFDVLHLLGQGVRRRTVEAQEDGRTDADTERMLRRLTFIEYARVPELLKTPFSHQRYLVARKGRA